MGADRALTVPDAVRAFKRARWDVLDAQRRLDLAQAILDDAYAAYIDTITPDDAE